MIDLHWLTGALRLFQRSSIFVFKLLFVQHCSGWRKNERSLAGVGVWIEQGRLSVGRQHRRADDRSRRQRNDVCCSAVGTPDWLPDEVDHWMHDGVASAALERDGFRLAGEQVT